MFFFLFRRNFPRTSKSKKNMKLQKLSQITKQRTALQSKKKRWFKILTRSFQWMFVNISIGITHSYLSGATRLQGQSVFPIPCWDPGTATIRNTFSKVILLVPCGKCSQHQCHTQETEHSITKWQFLSLKLTHLPSPKCNEECKHSLVNLYTQKDYS